MVLAKAYFLLGVGNWTLSPIEFSIRVRRVNRVRQIVSCIFYLTFLTAIALCIDNSPEVYIIIFRHSRKLDRTTGQRNSDG